MSGARPGRRFPTNLVYAHNPQEAIADSPIVFPEMCVFPPRLGIYPLKQWDQIELYVKLVEMPEGATFVNLTMFGFEGDFPRAAFPGAYLPGTVYPGGFVNEIYLEQFLQLDTTNGWEAPFQARIHLTATSPTIVMDAGDTYILGQRFSFPVEEDYIGWLIESDGASNTGDIALWAILGSE